MKNTLKNKWGTFWNVIASPGSVVFSILTAAELIFSYVFKNNLSFSMLLAVLATVTGGIAGSFIKDDYVKLTTENVLEKKGRSASRNLESIGKQLTHIREWIAEFTKGRITADQKRVLEEIDRHLSTTEMNVESGFADWVDIVPELAEAAELQAQVSKRQEEVIRAYVDELFENKKELAASKDEKKTTELKKRISDLEHQIKKVRHVPFYSGGTVVGPSGFGYAGSISAMGIGGYTRYCDRCGQPFVSDATKVIPDTLCSECRSNGGTATSVVTNSV